MKPTVEICGITLSSCVINGAGPQDESLDNLRRLGESASGAITVKSATKEPRGGNPEPRWHDAEPASLNAMGLPNLGYAEYAKVIPELKEAYGKPVIGSVSGFSVEDNLAMIKAYDQAGADIIEVNVACPNTETEVVGYDFEQFTKVLPAYRRSTAKPLAVKLPPYTTNGQFDKAVAAIKIAGIDMVVSINTIGQTTEVDVETGQTVLAATNGFGGMSGEAVMPIALGNVRHLAARLGPDFPIIGIGGVTSGKDAFKHLLCGAHAVGVATEYMKHGPEVFGRISG
ncbi:MAG: hypothetical protein WKG07_13285 [Hymenobacter sp.]